MLDWLQKSLDDDPSTDGVIWICQIFNIEELQSLGEIESYTEPLFELSGKICTS